MKKNVIIEIAIALICIIGMALTAGCGQIQRWKIDHNCKEIDGVTDHSNCEERYGKANWFLIDFDFDKLEADGLEIKSAEATGKDIKSTTGIGIINTETPGK